MNECYHDNLSRCSELAGICQTMSSHLCARTCNHCQQSGEVRDKIRYDVNNPRDSVVNPAWQNPELFPTTPDDTDQPWTLRPLEDSNHLPLPSIPDGVKKIHKRPTDGSLADIIRPPTPPTYEPDMDYQFRDLKDEDTYPFPDSDHPEHPDHPGHPDHPWHPDYPESIPRFMGGLKHQISRFEMPEDDQYPPPQEHFIPI